MDREVLKSIGLTEGESKIYLALLRLGQTTTGPIAKKSGVTTSKSYKILDRLEEKGLVSHVYKNKIKHFKAASPERILDLLTKQYTDLEEKRKEVESTIPKLLSYQKKVQEEQEAEVYYGIPGMETLFSEQLKMLDKGEEYFVIGLTQFQNYSRNVALFFKKLQDKRNKKGIVGKFLLSEDAKGSFGYLDRSKFCKLRYLPYASLVAINIHKDITIIGVFLEKPILFKITSKIIADTFKEYFKFLWKRAKT